MSLFRPALAAAFAAVGLTAACAPPLPKGVDPLMLEQAVGEAIGDPNTCVLVGQAGSGRVVWTYGSPGVCGKVWPACNGTDARDVGALLKAAGREGAVIQASCPSNRDRSRSVAWAAGPVPGQPDLVFPAVMEGATTPPGVVVSDKLRGAFERAGLTPAS